MIHAAKAEYSRPSGAKFQSTSMIPEAPWAKEVAHPEYAPPSLSESTGNSHPCAIYVLGAAIDFYRLCRWSLTDLNRSGLACELKKGVGSKNSSEGSEEGRVRSERRASNSLPFAL